MNATPDRLTSGHNKETADEPTNVADLIVGYQHTMSDRLRFRGALLVHLGPADESDGYTGRHRADLADVRPRAGIEATR